KRRALGEAVLRLLISIREPLRCDLATWIRAPLLSALRECEVVKANVQPFKVQPVDGVLHDLQPIARHIDRDNIPPASPTLRAVPTSVAAAPAGARGTRRSVLQALRPDSSRPKRGASPRRAAARPACPYTDQRDRSATRDRHSAVHRHPAFRTAAMRADA